MRLPVLAFSFLLPMAAHAATPRTPDREPASFAALAQCRTLVDPAARLACFDKAAADLSAAVSRKDVVVVDRQEMKETRRGLFGFNLSQIPLFGGHGARTSRHDDEQEEVKELETTVTSSRPSGYGNFEVTVAEGGAAWRSTDPSTGIPRVGDKIRIRKGTLGSYFIKVGDERAVRGMRVR